MKIRYLSVILCSFFLLAACGQQVKTEDSISTGEAAFIGSWLRTEVYVDGAPQGSTSADMIFSSKGTFISASSNCATSGTFEEINENTINMVMLESDCPGNLRTPLTVTYTYEIELNKNEELEMKMYTANVMETYVR